MPEQPLEERTCPHCGLLYAERYSPASSSWWATCPRCQTKDPLHHQADAPVPNP